MGDRDEARYAAAAAGTLRWWRDAIAGLLHPGRPPRGWVFVASVILAATLVAIGLMLHLGMTLHGQSGYFFRERKAGTYLSFALLVSSGFVSGAIAGRVRRRPVARFWGITAGLFVYMGCDDLLVIHERLDRWFHLALGLDPDDPVTDHLDDVIVGMYGLVAVSLAWRFRDDLLLLPFMVLTMIPAFAAFLVMMFFDWRHGPKAIEDSFKVLSGALILIGFVAAWLEVAKSRSSGSVSPGVDVGAVPTHTT